MAEEKATKAAAEKADKLGVDLDAVKGTGSEGTVKVSDVEEAAEKSPDSEAQVELCFSSELIADAMYGPDGVLYTEGEPVSERHFDTVLAGALDRDGKPMFEKGSYVEGGEA